MRGIPSWAEVIATQTLNAVVPDDTSPFGRSAHFGVSETWIRSFDGAAVLAEVLKRSDVAESEASFLDVEGLFSVLALAHTVISASSDNS